MSDKKVEPAPPVRKKVRNLLESTPAFHSPRRGPAPATGDTPKPVGVSKKKKPR